MTGPKGLIAIGLLKRKAARLPVRPSDRCGRLAHRFLNGYFRSRLGRPRIPIDWTGITPFTRRAYTALAKIKHGQTVTYSDLARAIKKPGASRAVGNALHQNPILLYLPCHRVIRSDGHPGGFAAGTKVKQWLLKHEKNKI